MKMGLFKSASANLAKRLESIPDERMHKIDRALACFSAGAWFGLWVYILEEEEEDKSWRVRYMIANQLYELYEAVGPEPTRTELVPAYVRLIRDNEAEVRIAAVGKVTKF
ncbi:hypothetical protein OROMI_019209 [Orobanche minor]